MEYGNKRRRSESVGAALAANGEGQGAAGSPRGTLWPICKSHAISSFVGGRKAHVDADYTALVERSAALLEKMKQRSGMRSMVTSSPVPGAGVEEAEPSTVPCVLDHFHNCAGRSATSTEAQRPTSLSVNLTAFGLAAPVNRCEVSSQTENSSSSSIQKEELSNELGELFTLLHVFFA